MNFVQRCIRCISVLLPAIMLNGTLSAAVQAEDVVRVGGAGSGLGAMKILAEAFERSHPGTRIKVLPSLGSSGGIKALVHGALDVAVSGRPLKGEELKTGVVAVELARTPFVFVVHNKVNKRDITTRELEMIYNGQLLKWPDGTRIRLVLRPASDTDSIIIGTISTKLEQAVKAASVRHDMIMEVTDQEAAEAVSKIPGALGASTIAQIETEKLPLKVLSFNGITPTLDALAAGRYPVTKPLYLVTAPKTPTAALQFVQFTRSAQGRAILAQTGALPVTDNMRAK
jgi:phosphate transport system substrate-binding protein